MKYIREYLKDKLHIVPIGNLTLGEEEPYGVGNLSACEIIVDNIHTGIYVYAGDYSNWLDNFIDEDKMNKL